MRGCTYRTAAITVAAVLFCGCVQKHAHILPPSTAAVSGNIDNARSLNSQGQHYNDVARGISGRIDAKASVIQKYWQDAK